MRDGSLGEWAGRPCHRETLRLCRRFKPRPLCDLATSESQTHRPRRGPTLRHTVQARRHSRLPLASSALRPGRSIPGVGTRQRRQRALTEALDQTLHRHHHAGREEPGRGGPGPTSLKQERSGQPSERNGPHTRPARAERAATGRRSDHRLPATPTRSNRCPAPAGPRTCRPPSCRAGAGTPTRASTDEPPPGTPAAGRSGHSRAASTGPPSATRHPQRPALRTAARQGSRPPTPRCSTLRDPEPASAPPDATSRAATASL